MLHLFLPMLFPQHGVPRMGDSLSKNRITQVLPRTPVWVFSTRCSPSGTDCSSVGSQIGSEVLPENLLHHGLLSMESQVLSEASSRMAFSSFVHRFLQGTSTCLDIQRLQGGCLLHRLQGHTCLTLGCTTDCREISPPVSGAPSLAPSSPADLGV